MCFEVLSLTYHSPIIFEFVQPQGERMAPTRPAIRTCAVGDDSACVNEQPRLCTTGFCVDEVTTAPGAVKVEAAPTTDRILVPLSGYSLVEQTAGGTPIVHNRMLTTSTPGFQTRADRPSCRLYMCTSFATVGR